MYKKWLKQEEDFLKDSYQRMSNGKLAEHFGVTAKSIENKLHKLGFKRTGKSSPPASPTDLQSTRKQRPKETSQEIYTPEDPVRANAIKIFDNGVKFYYNNELSKARREFQKVLAEFSETIDVARASREYLEKMTKSE